MSSLRISNLELSLMKALLKSKFTTGNGDFKWLSSVQQDLGGAKSLAKAKDSALTSGLIEIDSMMADDDYAVRLTGFASRLMLAVAKEGF